MLSRRGMIGSAIAGFAGWIGGNIVNAETTTPQPKSKSLEAYFFCGSGNRYKAKVVQSIGGKLNVHLGMKEFPGEVITAVEFVFSGHMVRLRMTDCTVPTVFGDYDEIIANTCISIEHLA